MEHFLEKGIGEISRLGSAIDLTPQETAQVTNKIQHFLRFNTRLGIPAIFHEECLAGYVGKGATAFPQMIGIGATWDPELLNLMTSCIREQMRVVGMHQGLSPVLDLAHDARWGRVEECFGEDPYLVSKFGVSYVRGLQGESLNSGILATAKHFVGYGSPTGGRNWGMGLITQRELLEHCARPFEAVIRQANLASIMNAYHEIDGLPCGFTSYFLTDLLRKQLGFTGFVVSDYFTISLGSRMHQYADTPAKAAKLAINAGLDIELPKTEGYGIAFREMVQKGEIAEIVIDQAVRRVLKAKFALGLFDNPFVSEDFEKIQQILY